MVGRTVSHYEILATLGEGGMGVVYRARDTRLGRTVALKMLHPARLADPERRRTFAHEARAASALNHPNIVTIYDVGSDADADFIVMEHVAGRRLSEAIPRSGMRVRDAVALAIPVADALAAAHAGGIVHRDLKPANVIVTPEGVPKLLDFGLAKLADTVVPADDARTLTAAGKTAWIERGAILGTLSYMSPEQAEGKDVDARADIFSFGAMLYEMVTGQRAFQGPSPLATLAAILHTDPRPADEIVPGLPRPLARLIARCLAKDPVRRWQSIADVRNSLDEIRQDLDSGGSTSRDRPPAVVRTNRTATWSIAVAAAALGLVAVVLWMKQGSVAEPVGETLRPVPLTSYAGSEDSPSLSADGAQVAFVWSGERRDNRDIYIKRFDAGRPLRLTSDPADDEHPVWSPDGNTIAFVRRRVGPPGSQVLVVPSLGGSERVLVDGTDTGTLDWSADGKWLVYAVRTTQEPGGLWVRSVDGDERHRLTTSDAFDREARFSPNGRSLAFVRGRGNSTAVYVLALDDHMRASAEARRVTAEGLHHRSPQWLGNAELIFTAGPLGAGYIERVSASGGRSRRVLTMDAPGGIAVSQRTNRLLISRSTSNVDVYRIDLSPDGTHTQSVTPVIASSEYDGFPVYSPNGEKIAFASVRSGDWQIWICDKDGANPIQITSLKSGEARPTSWKPSEGRQIGFVSDSDGAMRAYMVAAAGGVPERVPELAGVTTPIDFFWWSPNGSWIVYSATDGVWKVPTKGGGAAVKIGIAGGLPSYDGSAAVVVASQTAMSRWELVPLDGDAPRSPAFQIIYTQQDSWELDASFARVQSPLGWYMAGSLKPTRSGPLIFAPTSFLSAPVSGGEPHEMVIDAGGFGMSLNPNGRSLLFAKFVSFGADLVVVENFR